MIGEKQLRSMKPGSFLINNSRGTVVDLDARSGRRDDQAVARFAAFVAREGGDAHVARALLEAVCEPPRVEAVLEAAAPLVVGHDGILGAVVPGGREPDARRQVASGRGAGTNPRDRIGDPR